MSRQLKIGILGGGFAGLYAVFQLQKSLGGGSDITLFDKRNYLLYTPMLHEMATGTVNARHVVIPIRQVLNPRIVHIRCEAVAGVDVNKKAFETASGEYGFDRLLLAHGGEANFYSIPGVQEHGLTFRTIEDAMALRNRLVGLLERSALERNSEKRKRFLTICVAGGGCTGVEVVAEIAEFIKIILKRDYPEIRRSEIRLILIEARERILPAFPPYLSRVAAERLDRMGIEVFLNTPIQWAKNDAIGLKRREPMPVGLFIWAGGVRAQDLLLKPDVERDDMGRMVVNERLEIPGHPEIYAIGDLAHCCGTRGPLPQTASVAVQEARYVAQSISARFRGREVEPFRFRHRGEMASLGFMYGVTEIYGWHFKGLVAWILWKAFKLAMLPRYKTRFQILADWLITLVFKRDTAKLT